MMHTHVPRKLMSRLHRTERLQRLVPSSNNACTGPQHSSIPSIRLSSARLQAAMPHNEQHCKLATATLQPIPHALLKLQPKQKTVHPSTPTPTPPPLTEEASIPRALQQHCSTSYSTCNMVTHASMQGMICFLSCKAMPHK